jgi:hypothetical protein
VLVAIICGTLLFPGPTQASTERTVPSVCNRARPCSEEPHGLLGLLRLRGGARSQRSVSMIQIYDL